MQGFEYYTPTRVLFGKGAEAECGRLCAEEGAGKVLVHYGGASAEKSGLLGRVCASLTAAGVAHVMLGGVQPNPRLSLVRQAVELSRAEGVDFILAVGGGSVIDSAKAIAYGLGCGGEVWDFFDAKRQPEKTTPVGTVLTIAAAGSEMSNSCVITNDETGEKRGIKHDIARPRFAVMDPSLTLTVPPYQTAVGCVDILMHTMERYFTLEAPTMGLTDEIAEALMRNVIQNAHVLARTPEDYDARAEMMWASSLSHNGLTGCGNGNGDWAVHQLGHELSGKYDLAHGASLAAVWGSWARYVYRAAPARFARFATHVMELPEEGDDEAMALAGIEELEGFFWALEMPTNLEEAGLAPTDEDIRDMADKCSYHGHRTVGAIMQLDASDAEEIYKMAR
ncbi:iron-containing alcohol dehydrogenase [Ruminococcaceae bacterium OttesenSCG-928-O06]|nr:iron-containing alcohol dehydrogenase [Ruminococcaceae bacterium OttesenSCG-928-O06]